MQVKYHHFLNLKINHDYFIDGVNSIFEVRPSTTSKMKMKNFNILGKLRTNEFGLYCGLMNDGDLIRNELEGLNDLYFFLEKRDNLFFNYTNIDLLEGFEEILYLAQHEGNGEKLQTSNFVSGKDVLSLSPLQFNLQVLPETEGLARIRSGDGEVLVEKELKESDLVFNINLVPYGEGVYEYWLDDKLIKKVFATSDSIAPDVVGVAHFKVADVLKQMDENQQVEYSVDFEAPECVWMYEVVFSKGLKVEVDNLKIMSNNELNYGEHEDVELLNGAVAKVFSSNETKKLINYQKKNADLVVEYRNLHSTRKSELKVKLPLPDVTRVIKRIDENNNVVHVAPTLIYV